MSNTGLLQYKFISPFQDAGCLYAVFCLIFTGKNGRTEFNDTYICLWQSMGTLFVVHVQQYV